MFWMVILGLISIGLGLYVERITRILFKETSYVTKDASYIGNRIKEDGKQGDAEEYEWEYFNKETGEIIPDELAESLTKARAKEHDQKMNVRRRYGWWQLGFFGAAFYLIVVGLVWEPGA